MIVARIPKSGRSCAGTSAYILGQDGEHDPEDILATGYSCPGLDDVQDVPDVVMQLERESEDYKSQGSTGRPYAHWVISMEQGERPTASQVEAMIPVWRERMGMPAEAPLVWAMHAANERDNVHIHIQASTVIADERGRLEVRSLNKEDHHGVDHKRGGRVQFHDAKAAARACATICREQGWDSKNLAWDEHGQRVRVAASPDGITLPKGIQDAEAHSGQQHPAHAMGLAAMGALSRATTWDQAHAALAREGIRLERVALKNGKGEGAVLRALDTRTRLKLSALPKEFSLKALDQRFSGQTTPAPAPSFEGAARLLSSAAQARPAVLTPAKVRGLSKRMLGSSESWPELLGQLKREGWQMARAGKSGAVFVVPESVTKSAEIRLKMSDIPGHGTSYAKVSERFGITLENAVQNGTVDEALFRSVVQYPEAQKTAPQNPQNLDPNAVRLPGRAAADEALTGVPSTERALAERARDVIRESIQKDTSIKQTVSRLADAGINVSPVLSNDGQLLNIRLSVKNAMSIPLTALPKDCQMRSLAQKFGENYHKGPRPASKPDAGTKVLHFRPTDDIYTILSKSFQAICDELENDSITTAQRRHDNTKLTTVQPQAADKTAQLQIIAPANLTPEEKTRWIAGEQIKDCLKSAWSEINQCRKEGKTVDGWSIIHEELKKSGFVLESKPMGQPVICSDKIEVDPKQLGISWDRLTERMGSEPALPVQGWSEMNDDQRKIVKKYSDLREALKPEEWREILERLRHLNARMELTGQGSSQGGRVVLDDGRRVKLSAISKGFQQLKTTKRGDLNALLAAQRAAREAQAREVIAQAVKAKDKADRERADRERRQQAQPVQFQAGAVPTATKAGPGQAGQPGKSAEKASPAKTEPINDVLKRIKESQAKTFGRNMSGKEAKTTVLEQQIAQEQMIRQQLQQQKQMEAQNVAPR